MTTSRTTSIRKGKISTKVSSPLKQLELYENTSMKVRIYFSRMTSIKAPRRLFQHLKQPCEEQFILWNNLFEG